MPRREARRRARILKATQAKIVKARLKALVGTVAEVLVEGVSPESDYLLTGRLTSQAPDIDGQVYITAGTGRSARSRRCGSPGPCPMIWWGRLWKRGKRAKSVDRPEVCLDGRCPGRAWAGTRVK